MKISTNEAISAIYYALWQCGYDYAHIERNGAHMDALAAFVAEKAHPFFAGARQNTCEVYPYWPRAALLETASFHVGQEKFQNFKALRGKIMSAPNVADHERGEQFWAWLADFPQVLQTVMNSEGFRRYLAWERAWCSDLSRQSKAELAKIQRCLDVCRACYASPVRDVQLLISPIKCVYSADYHLVGETFVFSSGQLAVESVIHEFLHHVVHPAVLRCAEEIPERTYPSLDASYYTAGKVNAFEEYAVRCLTDLAMADALPKDLDGFLRMLLENN
ncbi:MAG: hypothetical protein IJA77_00755 [Clostridia bacterium]|nr:hypothetical protein [Clostridia bacterium]